MIINNPNSGNNSNIKNILSGLLSSFGGVGPQLSQLFPERRQAREGNMTVFGADVEPPNYNYKDHEDRKAQNTLYQTLANSTLGDYSWLEQFIKPYEHTW